MDFFRDQIIDLSLAALRQMVTRRENSVVCPMSVDGLVTPRLGQS
jgi:hypothetical protein